MTEGKYILVNGTFVAAEDYHLSGKEIDGILFTEKIRAIRTAFPFFKETLEQLRSKFLVFNHSFHEFTDREGAALKRQLERTLTKNKFFLGAVFHLTFWAVDGKVEYAIRAAKHENTDFALNEKGLFAAIFDQHRKPARSSEMYSAESEIFWKVARFHLNNAITDQFFLMNSEGLIVEAIESNIYCISKDVVHGCVSSSGAYTDISCNYLQTILKKMNLKYQAGKGLAPELIRGADEVMLVNAIDGVRWVVGFEDKRYFNQTIRKISELFSREIPS